MIRIRSRAWLPFSLSFLLLGCAGGKKERRTPATPAGIAERVGDYAVINLEAPEFAALSPDLRRGAYYLSQAVLAGRDIPYLQIHPRSVEMRRFLENISLNINYAAPEYYVQPFMQCLKNVWIHSGFYDLQTGRRLPPIINERELSQLTFLALANSGGQLGNLEDIVLKQYFILDTLFDSSSDSTPSPTGDEKASDEPGNLPTAFYQDISIAEIGAFKQKFPHNSRLVKRGDKLVELVWRTGDEELAAGPYAKELGEVIKNLEQGRLYLPPLRIPAVDLLIRHFRSGNTADFDSAAILWRTTRAPLDFVLGFTDWRFDPLGHKGLWTGLLFIAHDAAQAKIDRLQEALPEILASFPGRLPPPLVAPLKAAQLLTAIGANGPSCPNVYRDPPQDDGTGAPRQSLLFTNVIQARATARALGLESAFCDQGEMASAQRYAGDLAFAQCALGEIMGMPEPMPRSSGQPPQPFEVLQLARFELALLWLLHDPKLIDIGLVSDPAALDESYKSFARQVLIESSIDHPTAKVQARRLIANYLLELGGGLALEKKADGTYCRLDDGIAMRRQIGELAERIANILDQPAMKRSDLALADYASRTDPDLSREVARRLRASGGFMREAFIMPSLSAEFNPMGGLEDVHLEKPAGFTEQMLQFAGWQLSQKEE